MPLRSSPYGYWSSPSRFVLAVLGIVIGLGNLWRLPALVADHGGSAFLVIYLISLFGMASPLLINEWLLGRWMRSNIVWGIQHLSRVGNVARGWQFFGWTALIAAGLVLSYYAVIAGWTLAYAIRAGAGVFADAQASAIRGQFLALAGDPERSLAWHTIFMVIVTIIVAHGPRVGLERAASLLVPTAMALVVVLFLLAASTGHLDEAAGQLLGFRPGELGLTGVLSAISQSFYTLSLGVGVMMAYGVFMPANAPVVRSACAVLIGDTVFMLVGGMAIYAMVLAAGETPRSGVPLLFQQVPQAFGELGVVSTLAVFVLLAILTLTSAIGLLEPIVLRGMERFGITRVFAATACGMLIWLVGLMTILSFNVLAELAPGGRTIAEWLLTLTGSVLFPLTTLGLCIYVSRMLPKALVADLWGAELTDRRYRIWHWMMRYPARIGIIIVLIDALGIGQRLVSLWTQP
ncbi:sodium-dependent transporter [uncultured Abyssibacter sp.]|uniref:sodium-dependent transporter n=1 Tax=uncultured Abyssibacter sp. TaxID=2320202 RepID=UPI0032B30BA7